MKYRDSMNVRMCDIQPFYADAVKDQILQIVRALSGPSGSVGHSERVTLSWEISTEDR